MSFLEAFQVVPLELCLVAWWASTGSTYAEALASGTVDVGESQGITVHGFGGGTIPAATLTGLQGFTISVIPEASSRSLGLLGTALLVLRSSKLR